MLGNARSRMLGGGKRSFSWAQSPRSAAINIVQKKCDPDRLDATAASPI
jgi:hypothetical protein